MEGGCRRELWVCPLKEQNLLHFLRWTMLRESRPQQPGWGSALGHRSPCCLSAPPAAAVSTSTVPRSQRDPALNPLYLVGRMLLVVLSNLVFRESVGSACGAIAAGVKRVDGLRHSPSAAFHLSLETAAAPGVLRLKCLFQAIKQV